MATAREAIHQAYDAFNRRDIDAALAVMSDDIDWPTASEGGRVVGKDAIRAYWRRQWAEFDPHVEPLGVTEMNTGKAEVKVHQVVKTLGGEVLSDQVLSHVFSIANGVLTRMDIGESAPAFGPGH